MKKEIILFDGPNGIPLWNKAEKKGYEKVPVWRYSMEHPEIVAELNKEYIDAGADIILANTFTANRLAVAQASHYTTPEVVKASLGITKKAAKEKAAEGKHVKVGMAVGPLTMMMEPFGPVKESAVRDIYEEMIGAGADNGAEFYYVQTFMDLRMLKIVSEIAVRTGVPVLSSMTFQKSGRTLFGNTPEEIVREMEPVGITAIGLNCELGPDQMLPILKEYAAVTDMPLVIKANAGVPKEQGGTGIGCDPVSYADAAEKFFGYATYIGGCCGCDPDFIAEVHRRLRKTG
ncbi:MAG: homocysteine S-methyltransferase family protein [Lachnospiraceae bacterium]|nr:homocysteine S-methyltransferase family protein [Lachnospiraceae bacterium]